MTAMLVYFSYLQNLPSIEFESSREDININRFLLAQKINTQKTKNNRHLSNYNFLYQQGLSSENNLNINLQQPPPNLNIPLLETKNNLQIKSSESTAGTNLPFYNFPPPSTVVANSSQDPRSIHCNASSIPSQDSTSTNIPLLNFPPPIPNLTSTPYYFKPVCSTNLNTDGGSTINNLPHLNFPPPAPIKATFTPHNQPQPEPVLTSRSISSNHVSYACPPPSPFIDNSISFSPSIPTSFNLYTPPNLKPYIRNNCSNFLRQVPLTSPKSEPKISNKTSKLFIPVSLSENPNKNLIHNFNISKSCSSPSSNPFQISKSVLSDELDDQTDSRTICPASNKGCRDTEINQKKNVLLRRLELLLEDEIDDPELAMSVIEIKDGKSEDKNSYLHVMNDNGDTRIDNIGHIDEANAQSEVLPADAFYSAMKNVSARVTENINESLPNIQQQTNLNSPSNEETAVSTDTLIPLVDPDQKHEDIEVASSRHAIDSGSANLEDNDVAKLPEISHHIVSNFARKIGAASKYVLSEKDSNEFSLPEKLVMHKCKPGKRILPTDTVPHFAPVDGKDNTLDDVNCHLKQSTSTDKRSCSSPRTDNVKLLSECNTANSFRNERLTCSKDQQIFKISNEITRNQEAKPSKPINTFSSIVKMKSSYRPSSFRKRLKPFVKRRVTRKKKAKNTSKIFSPLIQKISEAVKMSQLEENSSGFKLDEIVAKLSVSELTKYMKSLHSPVRNSIAESDGRQSQERKLSDKKEFVDSFPSVETYEIIPTDFDKNCNGVFEKLDDVSNLGSDIQKVSVVALHEVKSINGGCISSMNKTKTNISSLQENSHHEKFSDISALENIQSCTSLLERQNSSHNETSAKVDSIIFPNRELNISCHKQNITTTDGYNQVCRDTSPNVCQPDLFGITVTDSYSRNVSVATDADYSDDFILNEPMHIVANTENGYVDALAPHVKPMNVINNVEKIPAKETILKKYNNELETTVDSLPISDNVIEDREYIENCERNLLQSVDRDSNDPPANNLRPREYFRDRGTDSNLQLSTIHTSVSTPAPCISTIIPVNSTEPFIKTTKPAIGSEPIATVTLPTIMNSAPGNIATTSSVCKSSAPADTTVFGSNIINTTATPDVKVEIDRLNSPEVYQLKVYVSIHSSTSSTTVS